MFIKMNVNTNGIINMPRLSVISLGWLVSWLLAAHEMRLAAGSFLPIASAHRLIAPTSLRPVDAVQQPDIVIHRRRCRRRGRRLQKLL